MKKIFLLILSSLALIGLRASEPRALNNEHLYYKVTYKWGLIQKQAGNAEFILKKNGAEYHAKLLAASLPWADRFFQVRDTLTGVMRADDLAPLKYVKTTSEGGVYRRDVLNYTYGHDNTITAHATRYKKKKNTPAEQSDTVLTAQAPGTDMLSVFYHARRLPFDTMTPGTVAYAKIFSGYKIEDLGITYEGVEDVKVNGEKYPCYKIGFVFTSSRIKNSSAPMTAWISTGPERVPVKLQGELPVGKIQVILNEKDNK